MAKFYGAVGYQELVQSPSPGVVRELMNERLFKGELTRSTSQVQHGEKVNADVNISYTLSILMDVTADDAIDYTAIRYVRLHRKNWQVLRVEREPPRVVISVGGLYNGPTRTTA